MRVIELNESITDSNDKDAEALRSYLNAQGILLVNIMSSPGAGKTGVGPPPFTSDLHRRLRSLYTQ